MMRLARALAACALAAALGAAMQAISGPLPPQSSTRVRVARALEFLKQEVPEAAGDLKWIEANLGIDVPEATARSMEALVEALQRASGSAPLRERVIAAVRDDLAIKVRACRNSGAGMATVARLVARTWSATEPRREVTRWDVHYLLAPLALTGSLPGESFPAFSSPTAVTLPPGRYVLWAQDPAQPQRRGPSREIVVGTVEGRASDDVTADLLIADK
jgi:hypothetical protein